MWNTEQIQSQSATGLSLFRPGLNLLSWAYSVNQKNRSACWRAALACAAVVVASPPLAEATTTANWVFPISGNWTDPSRWSTNPFYPNNGTPGGVTYDARIAATGAPYSVTLNTYPTFGLHSLTVDSADATVEHKTAIVDLSGNGIGGGPGVLDVRAGTYRMSGMAGGPFAIDLRGARVQSSTGAGQFIVNTCDATLDGVTLATNVTLDPNQAFWVVNGLTLDQADAHAPERPFQ